MDGNHKAIRWKFVIHGATDGFSRTIVTMKCFSDNRASTVLQHFLSATGTYVLPHKIRTDGGGENVDVWRHMIQRRGSPSCVLVGSSVHYTCIESLWSDVRKSVIQPIRITFTALEEEGILDPDNDVDIYCLHQALKRRINDRLTEFAQSWNNHLLRSEGNFTPLQLFHSCDHQSDSSDDDSDDTASVQEPSVIDHVQVPSLRFNPCVFLTTRVQTMLLTHSHLNDRELYRLIAASVGSHIRSMNNDCCSCD